MDQVQQFRAAHQHTGGRKPLTLGHPEFEGFEVIQTIETTHPPTSRGHVGLSAGRGIPDNDLLRRERKITPV